MITAALTFAFGFLLALLAALLTAPLVWKRARTIARQEFEATIPVSAREIQGTYDHLRAQTAFEARRREIASEEREQRAALERADAGRVTRENAELKARTKALTKQVAQQMGELEELNMTLSKRESEADAVDGELREVHHDLRIRIEEFEDLGRRFEDMTDIANERKVQIISLETRNDELSDELRNLERRSRENANQADRLSHEVEGLRAQLAKERATNQRLDDKVTRLTGLLADRDDQIERMFGRSGRARSPAEASGPGEDERPGLETRDVAPDDEPLPAALVAAAIPMDTGRDRAVRHDLADNRALEAIRDPAALREEIANIAAEVIDMAARREGASSPIEAMLASSASDASDDRSLAGRVHALRRRQRDSEAAE
ncbi:hypothetical protein U0C82_09715 [Fulvimarina sp. 2208YS6-2-32]|uniref:Uncharacterized protein n=1 Tax=Fulvimarina uroteuthidis TaxID=3098149 RepID=A0ABU5I5I9_9HYPH|nr:hypothetical protein [Fulvimarina sp. 2208YS6-2-32]MDY8109416.1 hypothetical protein [Fulvimarina sp. 2208YS6-2-32]